MLDDLIIFQKAYDLMLWIHPVVNRFPKSQRFVLGQQIRERVLDLIRSMIHANAAREKSAALAQASVELDELRILVRLAKDLRFVSVRQYGIAAERANEIGRLLAGWMRSQDRCREFGGTLKSPPVRPTSTAGGGGEGEAQRPGSCAAAIGITTRTPARLHST